MIAAWLLLGVAAFAGSEDALSPVLARLYAEARADEAAGRLGEAATGYAVVARADPRFGPAVLDLGRALEADGRIGEALAAYASRPGDVDAVEARVRLLLAIGDLEIAHSLIDDLDALGPNRPGWRLYEARIIAASDPLGALDRLSDYLEFFGTSVDDPGFEAAWRAIVDGVESPEIAKTLGDHLDGWARRYGQAASRPALEAARRELDIELAARALAASGADRLEPPHVDQLARARAAYLHGQYAEAARSLLDIIAERPRSAVVWVTLSDVRAAQGDLTASIEAIDAALEIDPLDADALVRRGDRLVEGFGGRLDAQAVDAYQRAVDRRPTDGTLWVKKARAERRIGRVDLATASYRQVLELDRDGPFAEEARSAIAGAGRALPAPRTPLLPPRDRPSGVPEAAWWAYHRALAWREHRAGLTDDEARSRAWQEVQRARTLAPEFVPALNLEAVMRADRGEMDEAVELLRASVNLDRGQAETWFTLAQVLEDRGDPQHAEAFARAADLGQPEALWRRARRHADEGRWWRARDTLTAYFAATTHGPHYPDAIALDEWLDRRIRLVLALVVLGTLSGIALPFALGLWRRSGSGLDALVEQAPREWPAIARVLSAIRHEVLKHDTSVLPSVVRALDEGDDEEARWVADRLYGPNGALARLGAYLEELRVLGRRHEIHLNLRFRDPDLGPLVDAARRLSRLEPELRAPTNRTRLADQLRDIVTVLHDRVYPALGQRIQQLATLRLTEGTVRRIAEGVLAEPALAGVVGLAVDVEWPATPPRVRIEPGDLLDLLSNLVRNALAASSTLPEGPLRRIGIVGRIEDDPITGLQQVAIAVCDHHPQRLTTAMIRSRYIARGLGLASDLASRAGGSIAVDEQPSDAAGAGYAKAVVVRLVLVEALGASGVEET